MPDLPPYHTDWPCHEVLEFRVDKGEVYTGPSFSVVSPHSRVTMEVTPGVKLQGPMVIIMCDGHLTITKP